MAIDLKNLKLPSVSNVGMKVLDIVSNDDVNIKDLSSAISADPVLSATLMKYANSPLYRRLIEVTNVRNAISILGLKNVRLAVMVATMRTYAANNDEARDLLWAHSFRIASLARIIARQAYVNRCEDIELTALMHDMGALVLSTNFPLRYITCLRQSNSEAVSLAKMERAEFATDHGEVLQLVADRLRIPEVTLKSLQHFHSNAPISKIADDIGKHHVVLALAHQLEWVESVREMPGMDFETQQVREALPQTMMDLKKVMGITEEDLESYISAYRSVLLKGDLTV